jgi:hypothetical protein
MHLADASLVTAAEALGTLDRNDFATYRAQRGHRHEPLEVVG